MSIHATPSPGNRNQRLIEDCITHGQLRLADDRLQPTIRGLAARFSPAGAG